MTGDAMDRVIQAAMDVERAMRASRQGTEYRCAGGIGIRGGANEGAHRRRGQRKQIGDNVGIAQIGDLGDATRLKQIRVIIVRRVVNRRRLGRAAGGVDHVPENALMQRQLRNLQSKALRLGHQVVFGGQRQLVERLPFTSPN